MLFRDLSSRAIDILPPLLVAIHLSYAFSITDVEQVLQQVLLRAETVGSWIVGRLIIGKHQRSIVEYLDEVK